MIIIEFAHRTGAKNLASCRSASPEPGNAMIDLFLISPTSPHHRFHSFAQADAVTG
jgi:hypothetical protein